MDVSEKRSAAEFCANVIARSDDLRKSSPSVVVARSTLRAIAFVSTPLRSVSTHIHRPYLRRCRGGCDVDAAGRWM
jgi:hypothetical protein